MIILGLGHQHTASPQGDVGADIHLLEDHTVHTQQITFAHINGSRDMYTWHHHVEITYLDIMADDIGAIQYIEIANLNIACHTAFVLDDIALADLERQ